MFKVSLPQDDAPAARGARRRAVAAQRDRYEWARAPGLPAWCRTLPADEAFRASRQRRFDWDLGGSLLNGAVGLARSFTRAPTRLRDYDRYHLFRPRPAVASRFLEDAEFARQRINGLNPLLIRRVRQIPPNFALSEEALRPVLATEATSLAALLDEGRLYVVDHAELEGCPLELGRFLEPTISAYYVDARGQLAPLAIQLGQHPKVAPVLFTPADDPWQWLLARTFVQSADAVHHEVVSHLVRTHLAMEACWVATCRALPPTHPIHELLQPHFVDTLAINADARTKMLAPGGPIDETMAVGVAGATWLIEQAWGRWSFAETDPLSELAVRDVDALPGYFYRDDTRALHAVIAQYVDELLRIFYRTDEDVRADEELQAWAHELTAQEGAALRGVPGGGRLERFEQVAAIVRGILWTVSCEHSAVNNGQYDQFGYVPNAPGALYTPAPRVKRASSEAEVTYALPPPEAAAQQLALVHMLSLAPLTPLGTYPMDFFQGFAEVQVVADRFRARLAEAGAALRARNETLEVPYTYLEPHRVGRSIEV